MALQTIVADSADDLFAARQALRAGKGRGKTRRVMLRAGVHLLSQPFILDSRDAGEPGAPISYITHPDDVARGNYARLAGGLRVPPAAFKPAQVPSGVPGVLVVNLFALGLNASSLGAMYPRAKLELFYGGRPMTLARDPNIDTDPLATWTWFGYENATRVDDLTLAFHDGPTGARWHAALSDHGHNGSLWLHAYTAFDWRDDYVRLLAVVPRGNASGKASYLLKRDAATAPSYPWKSGCRFYAVDNLALLDAPSEYYVSPSTGELYFLPPHRSGHSSSSSNSSPPELLDDVLVSVLKTVLNATDANHTTFANLTVEIAQGDLVHLHGSHLHLHSVTARNAGGACISLSGGDNSITDSTVHGCGAAGVNLSGGDLATLAPAGSSAIGNRVSNCSRIIRTYQPAVGFSGVGLRVANNTLTNGPHVAITGQGNDNIFEFNSMSRFAFECADCGCFYVGRSWAQRGNIARFNSFDTVRATQRLAQHDKTQSAFYLDDQMSGWDFYGNKIRNASQGVLLGGGRHNRIHSNIFEANDRDIGFDNRGMYWQRDACSVHCVGTTTACFRHTLEELHFQQPPYATRYPTLPTIYDDYPCVPVGNVIEDNKYCHAHSPHGAQFVVIDKRGDFDADKVAHFVAAWRSAMSNNVEDCGALEGRGGRSVSSTQQ